MTSRTIPWVMFLVVFLLGASVWADQFSGAIEAKLKSGKQGDSDQTFSNNSSTETGEKDKTDDGDGFLSEEKQKKDERNMPMWLAFGPQLGGGPNILFPFNDATNVDGTNVAPFENGGGGIGGGGGGVISARWLKGRFGLDLGVFAERNQTRTDMTVNGYDGNKFIYKYSIVRVPLLVKWYRLKDNRRLSLGIGPELVVGLDSTQGEIRSDEVIQRVLRIKRRDDLLAAINFGWGIKFKKWVVGIDLKIAYNITGPREYDKKVTPVNSGDGFEVLGSHALDARILLGLLYEIGLGKN